MEVSDNTGLLVAATMLCMAGVAAVRLGWRKKGGRWTALVSSGWMLILLSGGVWVQAKGGEFGLSYALICVTLLAWSIVAMGAQRRPIKRAAEAGVDTLAATSISHKLMTFVAAGPVAALASCQLTLVLTHALPLEIVNQMAIAALLFPLIWGISAYCSCAWGTPVRNATGFVIIALIATTLLYL